MSPHAYTEDQRVGRPAVGLFAALGRETVTVCQQKCTAVFEHVYESYPERNAGVYAQV